MKVKDLSLIKMKAAVLCDIGNLKIENVEKSSITNQNDALIKVKSVGICGSDIDRAMKTGAYLYPVVLGHEFCGEIEQIADECSDFKKGNKVVVAPILPCFQCESCMRGNYGQCDHYSYLGSRRNGGMAQYVVAPTRNLIKMPFGLSFEEGATVEPAAVTLHGMCNVKIEPGDTTVILGCGAIGLFALQFAKILGATKVFAVDIDSQKLEIANRMGATLCINARNEDPVAVLQQMTKGRLCDVVIETAGATKTQEQAIRMAKKQGRTVRMAKKQGRTVFRYGS